MKKRILWILPLGAFFALLAQQPVMIRQGGNTATVSAGGAVKVDGSGVTQPVSGTVAATQSGGWSVTVGTFPDNEPFNLAQYGGVAVGAGNAVHVQPGTGATFASTQSGTWTVQPGNTANTTAWLVTGTGGTFPATQSGNWTSRTVGNAGATLDATVGAATAPTNGLLTLGVFNTTEPSPTTGQSVGIQLDSKGRQRQVIMDAAGNTRGANVDANNNLGVVLPAETTKVLGTIRVQGNVGGVMDAANNASAPANVLVTGFESATQGTTQPTAATAGNVRRGVISTDGALYVRQGGPVNFSCGADNIAASLTQLTGCAGAGAGLKYYITDIVAQSTTSTAGQFILRTGTGTNCGTGTASIFPSAATVVRYAAPANTAGPTQLSFTTPIATAANVQICVLGVATNTVTIQVMGYSAP